MPLLRSEHDGPLYRPLFLSLVVILITRTLLPLFYPDTISKRRGSHVSFTLSFKYISAEHKGDFRYSAISEFSPGVRCAILKSFL